MLDIYDRLPLRFYHAETLLNLLPSRGFGGGRDAGLFLGRPAPVANEWFTRPLHAMKRRCGYDAITALIACLDNRDEPITVLPATALGIEVIK